MTMTRRAFISTAAATLAMTDAARGAGAGTTIVLVHGAWMGAWAWAGVQQDLAALGHATVAPDLPGHGADATPPEALTLDGYVDAVIAALPATGRVVLVGHSMAGMVISAVAEKVPDRIAKLIYVAAYLPKSGESLYQLSMTDADSHVGAYWSQENPAAYTPASIRPEGIAEVFCADCDAATIDELMARHRPEAIGPLGTPVTLTDANWGKVPKAYVFTLDDACVSPALQRRMAEGVTETYEIASSHSPMLAHPAELATILAGAAA